VGKENEGWNVFLPPTFFEEGCKDRREWKEDELREVEGGPKIELEEGDSLRDEGLMKEEEEEEDEEDDVLILLHGFVGSA